MTELGGMHCEGGLFTDKKLAPCINEQELSTAFKNSRKGIKDLVALYRMHLLVWAYINIAAQGFNVPFCQKH